VGGNVLCYLDLARHLAPDQPFYALQTPDPEEGEERLTSIEAMAASYLRELRRLQPAGPYRLGGWSMGGLVAFEMARQLEAEGQELELVALIDTLPPGVGPGSSPATDDELPGLFAQDLLRLLGRDDASLSPENLPEDFGPAQMQPLFETFAANLQASRSFAPRPFSGNVTLYLSEQTSAVYGPEILDGWSGLALGGLEASTLPGDHYSLLRRPRVELLAQELTARLAAL
jgi:thioesterase domain-containing protein